MKLLRLDLLAFGPFTDLSLALDAGEHGLHVIYGPNEAGKSSSLRALGQLFYGIPHNSTDNFIHAHPNLRIGGLLEGADGTRLEVVRRKGRTKTLRDAGDSAAIEESILQAILGGVDETTFRQRFGIDYGELRAGGEAVVRGGGDLGQVLFAAGAGLADVHQVQARIDSEMEELFKQRGTNPRINEAVRALKEARNATEAVQLSTSDWAQHDQALRTAQSRQDEIEKSLLESRMKRSRLERVDKALPLIDARQRIQRQHAEVADAHVLPRDFSSSRSKTLAEFSAAQAAAREAAKAIERLQEDISNLHVPDELLAHRSAITRLHTELGSYQKAGRDRPGLVAQTEAIDQRVQELLHELGREPKREATDSLRLNRADRQRIQELAADCKTRFDQHRAAEQTVRNLSQKIIRVDVELDALPECRDSTQLASAIRRAQKQGNLDQQQKDGLAVLGELEGQAEVELARLGHWSGTLDELERLPVPAQETVERFANELADAEAELARIEERIGDRTQQLRETEQSLETLRLKRDVPTEDDLTRARRRRDEAWRLVQQVWRGDLPADDPTIGDFATEFGAADLAQAFDASVQAADAVADRLRSDADQVAKRAGLTTEQQVLRQRIDKEQEARTQARKKRERLAIEWRQQWAALDVDPLPPREMRSWLDRRNALAELAARIRQQRTNVDATESLLHSLRDDLNRRLDDLGLPQASEPSTLAAVLEFCEKAVEELSETCRARQRLEQQLKSLRADLADAEGHAKQAEADLQQWQSDWAKSISALGLDRDASPSEANAVMEAVDGLFSARKDHSELQDRIDGIDREANTFETSVRQLLELVDPTLLQRPVEQAVSDLYDRLNAASTAQTKRDGWQTQFEAEQSKRDKADAQAEQLQRDITALCKLAGCGSPDDLPLAEDRSAERARVGSELSSVEEQLVGLAAGAPLETFIVEAREFHPDQVRADLQRLDEEIANLDRERKEVAETTGGHREALRRMDGSSRAADAQEEAEHLLARIRGDAEQYVRLRLASFVLRRAIDRYREASKGPVLARASELFAQLTLGAFVELRADFDDKGAAVLAGVRSGGQTVHVDGMSEGTCDQLYLALRLALLESSLAVREPLPFVVDDILIMFDDQRAVAALRALADLSHKTQVIFFTHHEHLVRLAKDNLNGDVLFTHALDRRRYD